MQSTACLLIVTAWPPRNALANVAAGKSENYYAAALSRSCLIKAVKHFHPVVDSECPSRLPAARALSPAASFRVVERPPGVGVWVAARRGLGALGALKAAAEAAPSAIPAGWLRLHRAVAVTVVVKGKDHDVITNAATVGQLLSAMGIEPDGNDRIAPPLQTPLPHLRHDIRFHSVDVRQVTLSSSVLALRITRPAPVRVSRSPSLRWPLRRSRS